MDYSKLVKEKKEEQGELEARWQADEDLLYLKKYVMTDANNKKVDDIVNVTLNRPAVFAANAISALGSASEQGVVTSNIDGFDTKYIEDFQKAGFASADDRLRKQGKPLLNPFADTQFFIRGRTARRVLFRIGEVTQGGKTEQALIPDIVPWDGRFVTYDIGGNGLDWAAYEMTRSKAAIEAEYEIVVTGKTGKVLDVWDTEGNYVYIDGKIGKEQAHDYGFCPVVIQIVPIGYGAMLLSEGSLKYEGESGFFLIRSVVPEINRLVSIMQTLNLKAVKPPVMQRIKGKTKAAPYKDLMDSGQVAAMEPTDKIEPIKYGDAQRSATIAYNGMSAAIDQGTISPADLGTIERPPASGVRAIMAGEHINNLLRPRLEAKAGLNKQTAEMFTEQVIQIGGSVELGVKGHKRTFETSKLEGEYDTTYNYSFKSPSVDAGLYSLAGAAGHLIPNRAKRAEILQREDPDGDEKQLRWEEAERLSPAVKMYRGICSLKGIPPDPEMEAEYLAAELGMNVDQMLAGDISQQPKPEKAEKPTQMVSLFGGAAGRVSPEPEEEEE